ncbi:MAG: MlaD family protein [Gemmataceae bacterium]
MTRLSKIQTAILGSVVLGCTGLAAVGLSAIAVRQGIWAETVPVCVSFPEAHDVVPGTPVRVRGVEAGHVVAVEYPQNDHPQAAVMVRMSLNKSFAGRLYADGSAGIHNTGLLGAKVIAISPGSPASGPLTTGELRATKTVELADAAARISAVADEAEKLIKDVRAGKGSAGKLISDEGLYNDLTGLAKDARVAVNAIHGEAGKVERFVADGRDTLRSVKQGTDAIAKLPLVRGYVEDATAILVRPTCRKEEYPFNTTDLFDGESAILSEAGKEHLRSLAEMIKAESTAKTELVVVSQHDPEDTRQTASSALELTRKRSEVVAEYLKLQKAHRISWVSSRTVTTLGLGMGTSPVVPSRPLPPSHVAVILFTPG